MPERAPVFLLNRAGPGHELHVGTRAVCGVDLAEARTTSQNACLVHHIPRCRDGCWRQRDPPWRRASEDSNAPQVAAGLNG